MDLLPGAKGPGDRMKLVLLSPRLAAVEGGDEIRECVDERWGRLLSRAGFLGITATLAAPPDGCAALPTWPGHPHRRQRPGHGSDSPLSRDRDGFELSLLASCAQAAFPCSAPVAGPSFWPWAPGPRSTGWTGTPAGVTPGVDARHQARRVVPRPVRGRLVPPLRHCRAPPGLARGAVAPDGGVEAFEHATRPWFGVMWHPERDPARPRWP
jgi:putative glutamine amidotransferase